MSAILFLFFVFNSPDGATSVSNDVKLTNKTFVSLYGDIVLEVKKKKELIENDLTEALGEFLRKQNGYVDKNYICTKCGNKGEKIKITTEPLNVSALFTNTGESYKYPFPELLIWDIILLNRMFRTKNWSDWQKKDKKAISKK